MIHLAMVCMKYMGMVNKMLHFSYGSRATFQTVLDVIWLRNFNSEHFLECTLTYKKPNSDIEFHPGDLDTDFKVLRCIQIKGIHMDFLCKLHRETISIL